MRVIFKWTPGSKSLRQVKVVLSSPHPGGKIEQSTK